MLQFTNDDIAEITKEGISFKTPNGDMKISFFECGQNFAFENSLDDSNCVATRNITVPEFIFYSNPKVQVRFKKNGFIVTLFSKKPWHIKFYELQKDIERFGYTTWDLS